MPCACNVLHCQLVNRHHNHFAATLCCHTQGTTIDAKAFEQPPVACMICCAVDEEDVRRCGFGRLKRLVKIPRDAADDVEAAITRSLQLSVVCLRAIDDSPNAARGLTKALDDHAEDDAGVYDGLYSS